jgi:hypothetical protein
MRLTGYWAQTKQERGVQGFAFVELCIRQRPRLKKQSILLPQKSLDCSYHTVLRDDLDQHWREALLRRFVRLWTNVGTKHLFTSLGKTKLVEFLCFSPCHAISKQHVLKYYCFQM